MSLTNQFERNPRRAGRLGSGAQTGRGRASNWTRSCARKSSEPFLLVEYQNEAGRRMDELARLAKQENVVLEPAVLAGFPEQSADMKEPALLWAELAFLDSLLTTAINAKVTTIHFMAAQMPLTNAPSPTNGRSLAELPDADRIDRAASPTSPGSCRPCRCGPTKSRPPGLPAAPTNKPALFIDRLVLRKQSPDKPDEVRVSLRAVGFVFPK